MSRNNYTKLVRHSERAQLARQKKELVSITKELRCKNAESTAAPLIDKIKEHRRTRLKQKWLHKPERLGAVGPDRS